MDIDYTCGHKFQSYPGAAVPTDCPACNQGNLIGAKGKFYMSEDLSKKMREALMSANPLANLERPPVNTRCLARCKHQWRAGTVIWHREGNDVDALLLDDDGHTTFWAWEFRPLGDLERDEVIKLAREATDHLAGQKVEVPLGHLYDIGMLRKAGDQ